MTPDVTFSGTILDSKGRAIPGVRYYLYKSGVVDYNWNSTNSNGTFSRSIQPLSGYLIQVYTDQHLTDSGDSKRRWLQLY